ncbi:MAG: HdeD family acid-resistance protein [Acetobacter sp.]|jgi:uncharacterized membrane protein HdeD (DUF308 family)|nr:HdeD family acid-resistance protein [Acetobacter sp.]
MFTDLTHKWGMFVILGLISIILGALAWIDAVSVSLASAVFIGILLLIAGVFQCIHAFAVREWGAFLFSLLGGILYIIGGGMLIEEPAAGSIVITIFISACLVIGGTIRCVIATKMNGLPGWWVGLLSGLVSIMVGLGLYMMLPWSGLWLPGTLVAFELIVAGVSWVQTGLALRKGIPPATPVL